VEKKNNKEENQNTSSEKGGTGIVVSSGPIEATPNTEIISVNILNVDNKDPKEVIIEIKNWTNCPPVELGKAVLLCSEQVDPSDIGYEDEENEGGSDFDPTILPTEIDEYFPTISKPLYFKLPPQMQLTVLASFPQPPLASSNPCYEVRVSLSNSSNVLISSYGLNEEFNPQIGNTVLHHQFFSTHLQLPFPEKMVMKKEI
jgi:hypothetical protein